MKNILLKYMAVLLVCYAFPANSFGQRIAPAAYSPDVKVNLIRTWTAKAPVADPNEVTLRDYVSVQQTSQYFDGLGRPLQTVVKQGSLVTGKTAADLVNPVIYDEFGRETFKYLPFAANTTGGNTSLNNGAFKLNPFQQDSAFNKAQFPGETYYYTKTYFEISPLNRVTEVYAPGNSWAGSEDNTDPQTRRSNALQYLINAANDSVRTWKVNAAGAVSTTAMYLAGTLYKNVRVDEHKQQVVEFKDKDGKVILKKVQLAAIPSTGHSGWLCTYYVYDDLNQLRCVVQPKGVELLQSGNWSLTTAILNEFCFRYDFDERNRMIVKKIPGAGDAWMVYDARDRLVLMQDSMNRGSSTPKWLYTLYDALDRPVATGLWNNTNDRAYHKAQAYTSIGYPNLTGQTYEELTHTYYDDYSWAAALPTLLKTFSTSDVSTYLLNASTTTWPYPQAVQTASSAKAIVTGGKVKVLGSSPVQTLVTVNFYDDKGRVIQIRSQNITGGVDVVTTQYSWSGQPLVVVQKQEKLGNNPQTHFIVTKMDYDSLGRVLAIKKTVSSTINGMTVNKPEQLLVSNEYDALGQLSKKTLGTPILDSIRNEYNIRGWLLGVNRAYAKDVHQNNYFGFDLGYDKKNNGLIGNQAYTAAQYNGNIAGIVWKTKGDSEKRKYDYGYDATNRLLKANFTQYNGSNFNTIAGLDFTVKDLSYDANGNIISMSQRGWKLSGSSTIDSLLYTYDNSNKLKNVIDRNNDVQTKLGDFRSSSLYMEAIGSDKNIAAIDYVYDGNGNMIRDRNKDIGDANNNGIIYNHLNLPSVITVRTTAGAVKGSITYTYDAAGNKLKKVVAESGKPPVATLYFGGGSVFENDTLQFLAHEEGRLRYAKQYYQNGSSSYKYFYDFFLKDHLGNVRMVLTEQRDTAVYMATMEAAYRAKEDSLFHNIPQTSYAKTLVPGGYPVDATTNPNDSIARVNGSGRKVGPALVLKVMSGDKLMIATKYFYRGSGAAGPASDPLNDILSALAGGLTGAAGEVKGTLSQLNNTSTSPLLGVINSFQKVRDTSSATKPRAYLNWMALDEQLKYEASASGAKVVGNADALLPLLPNDTIRISKNGFLYIYVSNETQNRDVFFDNLSVQHFSGPLTEETHYYPFGLTMAGISSKALGIMENRKEKFQGQEFNDALDVDYYEFRYRNHDPQIGRFIQIDPLSEKYVYNSTYAFSENKVTSHVELEGLECIGSYYMMKFKEIAVRIGVDFSNHTTNGMVNYDYIKQRQISKLEKGASTDEKGGVILHRTVSSSATSTINSFENRGIGTHFLVGSDGVIYQTASLDKKTSHLRESQLTNDNLSNANSIGIEVVGNYNPETKEWDPVTTDQAKSVAFLVNSLITTYGLTNDNIYNHEDVQPKTAGEGRTVFNAIRQYLNARNNARRNTDEEENPNGSQTTDSTGRRRRL